MSTSSATAAVEDNAGRDALTPNERLGGVVDVRNCLLLVPLPDLAEATHGDALVLAYTRRLTAAAAGDEVMVVGVLGCVVASEDRRTSPHFCSFGAMAPSTPSTSRF